MGAAMAWRCIALVVATLICAALVEAQAADDQNGVYLLTPGHEPSCGGYTAERVSNRGQQYEFWALGFLSGVNWLGNSDSDFLKGLDGNAVWAWMDNYCREHPLERFP